MSSTRPVRLPVVVATSVVRSSHQGESHGGVYLVDLERGDVRQVIDWNDPSIAWEGRGADRGLRGIAFRGDSIYLAASDEIFVYDRSFAMTGSYRNPYLKHCHEITIRDDVLYATSTGFDTVLEIDLVAGAFVRGTMLRFPPIWRKRRRLNLRPRPRFGRFDPNRPDGPAPGDTAHINNVFVDERGMFVSGTGLGTLWRVDGGLERFARIPYGTHNARPLGDDVIMNHTATDEIALLDRRGRAVRSFPLPHHDESALVNATLSRDVARPAFGRGLAVAGPDLLVGGSSPATVTAYRLSSAEVLASVTISMDVRNAVHGLEVWPFAT
jgi:hypothetical protein